MNKIKIFAAVFAAILIGLVAFLKSDAADPYPDLSTEGLKITEFSEVDFPYAHEHAGEASLPFMASAIIDIDGDTVEEVFIGGGARQQDGLFAYRKGAFVDITEGRGLDHSLKSESEKGDATMGAVALDADNDGDNDLLVARESGVYLYTNDGGRFSGRDLKLALNEKTTALSVAPADINRDGKFDLYVSGYIKTDFVEGETIFNQDDYGATSAMFLNNGDDTFRDITKESGLYYIHNTFQAVFVDLDGDRLEDLVVAHDTGQVRTWKNMGGLKFKNMPNPNSEHFSYPMGIAVGDYNNDGRPDLFFSNVGTTVPESLVRGDLRDDQNFNKRWILFRNDGGFQFTDVAEETAVANFEFSWGAIFEDLNLDGLQDLVVSENYSGWPVHALSFLRLPGRVLLQRPDNKFAAAEADMNAENANFGITPLSADFNSDGYPDLIHINLAGSPKAQISQGGTANYVKVQLPNRVASIGATVTVTTASGKSYAMPFIKGEGLCGDPSSVLIFGLGEEAEIASIRTSYLDGRAIELKNPPAKSLVRF
ncbi:MAG: CRTAC1 family protein [bacterium]|nr:CRTAC1 family protein [bacterium]